MRASWERVVLGLGAGLLANVLIPGKRSQGLIITCVIGIAGALLGGWAASKLFHIRSLQGFFNLSTWLTAIAGAAVLLLAYPPAGAYPLLTQAPEGVQKPGAMAWTGQLAACGVPEYVEAWVVCWQPRRGEPCLRLPSG
jgi:uncharacterized membrane protein YeaQ/YmgE (transglycosylase-associated protein family)